MVKGIYKHIIMLLTFFLLSSTLSATMFTYETVTGSLNAVKLDADDSYYNPIADEDDIDDYENGEYWQRDGYVGRYIFQGPPTTITVNNIGPNANHTGCNPRFYYTRVKRQASNGVSNPNYWREFFLVIRIKGKRHGGSSNDFTNENFIIEYPGEDFSTQVGA